MRVMLASDHQYPMVAAIGAGTNPTTGFYSGAGQHTHDLLARGLAEAGHEVLYHLPQGGGEPPPGIRLIAKPDPTVDLWHACNVVEPETIAFMDSHRVPGLLTCNLDPRIQPYPGHREGPHWVYVSLTLARSCGSERYVHTGLDPADFEYREAKSNYLLFMASLMRAWDKGLDTALEVSRRSGVPLVVAGSTHDHAVIQQVADACKDYGAEYVGDVRGERKNRLLGEATALLFPTRLNEAAGLVLIEALFSGTPVISSTYGACTEMVSPEVGVCCASFDEYLVAVEKVRAIAPSTCRAFAMERYHYRRMAADYVKEYQIEIAAHGRQAT